MIVHMLMFYFSGVMVGIFLRYQLTSETTPRKVVMVFARLMDEKLILRDHRGDWRDGKTWERLCDEMGELEEATAKTHIAEEAIDVAITAMQHHDEMVPLCDHEGRGHAIGLWRRMSTALKARVARND